MTKIKICGLRREEDIAYANEALPDFAGFVFAQSRRQITKEQAAKLRGLLKPEITAVGVFVKEAVETVAQLLNEGIIDMAQLHGDETEDYVKRLKELTGNAPIIKVVRVASAEDVAKGGETAADYLLFDTYSVKEYGGTGSTFDWSLLRDVQKPFFLAGGINAQNVAEAINQVKPFAVDVSSAVEVDGWKDEKKIRDIVARVHSEIQK